MTAPYSSSRIAYEGTETTETSIVRAGGAEDPAGQAQSRKIVTTANTQWLRPFRCAPWAIWNETTGADVTVTVYGNGASVPLTDEVFMDVEYLGDASSSLGTIKTTTKANVLATGAAGTSDSSSWAGGTTAFKLVATLSSPQPGRPGLIHVRPKIGKANATFYLDPQIELTPASAAPSAVHLSSRYAYEGTETTETSIVRSGGTAHSRKIVTTANSQWLRPYRAEPYAVWNDSVGEDVTVTVYGNVVGSADACDVWMDVEYLGDASSTLGTIVTTTRANVLATCASLISDGSAWSSVPVMLDPTTAFKAVISNSNRTATRSDVTASAGGVWSSEFRSSGKYYLEFTIGITTNTTNSVGVAKSGATYLNLNAGQNCAIVAVAGNIWTNNVIYSPGALGALANGDVISGAIDLDNLKAWFRKNGGDWNGQAIGSSNPATGTGAATMASGSYAPSIGLAGGSPSTSENITLNTGQAAFIYTPPSGFGVWGYATTAFKLVATLNSPQPGQPGLINVRVKAAKPSSTFYIDPTPVLS